MAKAPQSRLRRRHERFVVDALSRRGPQSRADLARSLGVSAVTMGKIVDEMVSTGYLHEPAPGNAPAAGNAPQAAAAQSIVGRPPRPVAIEPHRPRLVLAELSRRSIRLAAVPLGLGRDTDWHVTVPMGKTQQDFERRLREASLQLNLRKPWAVAVSVPGVVDEPAGRVLFSPNLHWTERLDLPAAFASVWDTPACFVQEIRASALAHHAGAGAPDSFLLVDFDEGVGGAIVINGRLYRGPMPLSGELGHIVLPGQNRRCGCGSRGCLETVSSNRGLARSCREYEGEGRPTLRRIMARVGSLGVEPWLADTLNAMGATLGATLSVLGLSDVVITGWPVMLPDAGRDVLTHALESSTLCARFDRITCRFAERRRMTGLIAAAIDRVLLPIDTDERQSRKRERAKA